MQILTVQQELVLLLRFGQARRPATEQQVAQALGLSVRTVRRIEGEALRRLRLSTLDSVGSGQCDWDEV
jgi:DNA-directed RNA polymerase sigma subunit (sigma70/sigma32)